MTKVVWDAVGERRYELGTDRCVLYTGGAAVPWNGLTAVNETPDGGDLASFYMDGQKYADVTLAEDFKATLVVFTYPDQFEACLGVSSLQAGLFATAQLKQPFGLTYRTKMGNDVAGNNFAYKIHLVYNAMVISPSNSFKTQDSNGDPSSFTFNIATRPMTAPGRDATAHIIIDSRSMNAALLARIEALLYGTTDDAPRLPSISDLNDLFAVGTVITITDNGDGSWTATGPGAYVYLTDPNSFEIAEVNATYLDANTYTVTTTP